MVKKVAVRAVGKVTEKRWPVYDDLFAWGVFMLLDDGPPDSPGDVDSMMRKINSKPPAVLHQELYEKYQEFRDEFLPFDYQPIQARAANEQSQGSEVAV
jgi:hypothetical protein